MRSPARLLLLLLALVGCVTSPVTGATTTSTGGTGGAIAGTGGSGGTIGSGGSGAMPSIACLQPLSCPGEDTDCRVRTCIDGACGFEDRPEGTETAGQVAGDCQKRVCDGRGSVKQIIDDADLLDDLNPCTDDFCAAGYPLNVPYVALACGAEGEGSCDGQGSCVACVTAAQCGGDELCFDNRCVPPTCLDHLKNGDETGLDCGGSACGPCYAGQPCKVDPDCRSGRCDATTKLCAASSCSDGVKNGDETDTDCGGSCPKRCGFGEACKIGEDCLGQLCSGALCLPSCVDGVKDGAETGLDCGGHACGPCKNGEGCERGADCQSGLCQRGVCAPVTCTNGMKDDSETDLDCGGSCAPCAPGKGCTKGSDCTSKICAGTLCATPTCDDHVTNGQETGVDCGGSCPPCAKNSPHAFVSDGAPSSPEDLNLSPAP